MGKQNLIFGVDHDPDRNLLINASDATTGERVFTGKIPPREQADFARAVINHAFANLRDVTAAIRYGDCATCKNRRLVSEERHGRKEDVRCPDCTDAFLGDPFEHYPIAGGGTAPRGEVHDG
jgi:hypothetical protein